MTKHTIYPRKRGFGVTMAENNVFESEKTNAFLSVDQKENVPLELLSSANGIVTYRTADGVILSVCTNECEVSGVIRQSVSVRNDSVVLKNIGELSAVHTDCVCYDHGENIAKRLSDGSILVHYCLNKWQAEGQWRTATPEDLGVYPKTGHDFETTSVVFASCSSWSTAAQYPLIIIEDKKRDECWFFEIEGGYGWKMEIGLYGGFHVRSLFVKAGEVDDRNGFCKTLVPKESYTSSVCLYGVVNGGFEQAVKALWKYKRLTSMKKPIGGVIFNDYMNCNWANISEERLLGLIDAAAEAGVSTFCIDDGWERAQGLWFEDERKFKTLGLQGVIDRIRSKGMTAGIWFEFEVVPLCLQEILCADDIFLTRKEQTISPARPIGNFRSAALIRYLNERVDVLYRMGIRYIKNDHNNAEGVGTDMYGSSEAIGTRENAEAFLRFIDGLQEKYSDLTIENCASGAMRADWGTLKHFALQSVSDQEIYYLNPSVLVGSSAFLPTERAGSWCYPNHLAFDRRENHVLTESELSRAKDGEETVFNIVNGFMGQMYLSGRIEQADDYNFALLKEGISLYLKKQAFLFDSYPIYPCGRIRMSKKDGCFAFGFMWFPLDCSKNINFICSIYYNKNLQFCQ